MTYWFLVSVVLLIVTIFVLFGAKMNLQEFSALKVGDKIENPSTDNSGIGEIVEMTSSGVRVVWGVRHERETKFFYSVVGTAWMNWNKAS